MFGNSQIKNSLDDEIDINLTKKDKFIAFFINLFLQYCDKVSLYGYWRNLSDALKNSRLHVKNSVENGFLSAFILFPFLGLSTHVVYKTVMKLIDFVKTILMEVIFLVTHPKMFRNQLPKVLSFMIVSVLLVTIYSYTYSLQGVRSILNEKHGLSEWWSTFPTEIATTVFNTFAFMNLLVSAYDSFVFYMIYSSKKRRVLKSHREVNSFFKNYPKSVNQFAKTIPVGLARPQ